MTCLSCRRACSGAICAGCRRRLHPAPDRMIGSVRVSSVWVHETTARNLVHRLKYEAVWGVAERLSGVMVGLLPPDATALVPIPRVVARRARYGIDPAAALARALASRSGLPVQSALRAIAWIPRRAGGPGRRRGSPRFGLTSHPAPGCVLIDDVVTSGATLAAAATLAGSHHAVTVTAGRSALTDRRPAS